MMGGWVKRIGTICGFKRNTICYTLRYAAGNKLDENGMSSMKLQVCLFCSDFWCQKALASPFATFV